ncbi:MAG: tetratricopeptide repeat protein [Candidatus Omnitrophota bacterium]
MINRQTRDKLAVVLILLAVFSVYLNTLPNRFVFDDRHMIVDNNYIKHLRFIPLLFKNKITSSSVGQGMCRPVLMLSFAFNYLFSNLSPHGYHLFNILIHFLNAWLLYLFLKLFLKDLGFYLRLGLTLVFCLHPVNTEAVAYISSRSTILSSFFILSSLYTYVQWRLSDRRRRYIYWSLGCYVLALLTKESGLVLPGLILAYEFIYISGRIDKKEIGKILLRILPFIILTFAYLILIQLIFGHVFGLFNKVKSVPIRSFWANISIQSVVSFLYLYLFLFPFNLCIDHNIPSSKSFLNSIGLISFGVIIIIVITAALFLRKRWKFFSLSCFWYFIVLAPQFYCRLNIVSAEHHAYLANFSLYFILGLLLSKFGLRDTKNIIRYSFFFILPLFFILTLIRNFQWRNEYMLWKSAIKVNPKSGLAHGSLGLYLVSRGFKSEGEEHLKLALDSDQEVAYRPTMFNLATYYALYKNDPGKGMEILNKNKDYLLKVDPVTYLKSIGLIYMRMGMAEDARLAWERAIRIYPENPEIKSNLGWWYLNKSADIKTAKGYFKSALKDNPDFLLTHLGLAAVLEKENLLEQAIEEYNRSIKLAPDSPDAYYRAGVIYAMKLLDTRAEWYFKKTIQLIPDFAPAYYNLCIFYLSLPKPDYQQARENFDKAKELGFVTDREIEERLLNGGSVR